MVIARVLWVLLVNFIQLPGANGVPNIVANGGGVHAGAQDAEWCNTSKTGSLGSTPMLVVEDHKVMVLVVVVEHKVLVLIMMANTGAPGGANGNGWKYF